MQIEITTIALQLIQNPPTVLIFTPLLFSLLVYLVGKISPNAAKSLTAIVVVALFIYSIILVGWFDPSSSGYQFFYDYTWVPDFNIHYAVGIDGISLPLVLIGTFLSMIATLGSWRHIDHQIPLYYALLLVFETGILGVFVNLNLLLFFVFWELVLIPMFFFILLWGGPRKKYAGLKFLLYTHVGSVAMLLGFILIYLITPTHTLNLLELGGVALPANLQVIIMGLVTLGFAVKLPMWPFHTWLPDAHVEAPAPISVLLAGLLLKMGGYGFVRINLFVFPTLSQTYAPLFIIFALITIIYAGVVALAQTDIKRMIALTSVNHMGVVLLGVYSLTSLALVGAVWQMFNHALAIGMLFLLSGIILDYAGTREIPELKGLLKRAPKMAWFLFFAALAGMSLPGLSPFVSEFLVFVAAFQITPYTAVAVVGPILVSAYFLWVIHRTVFSEPQLNPTQEISDVPTFEAAVLLLLVVPLVVFGIFPDLLLRFIMPTVSHLVSVFGG